MMKPSTEQDYRRRIARVVEAILIDPGAPHTLESLAALAYLSPYHFHRVYRALTGESVVDTVQRVRLAQAAQRLTDDAARVTAVAHDAGYDSPQAFARAFRGFTGVTPSEFRARQQHLAAPAVSRHPTGARKGTVKADENGKPAAPEVKLVEIAPLDVLCLRHDGPVATIAQTFRTLMFMLRCEESSEAMDQRVGICVREPAAKGAFQYHAGIVAGPYATPTDAIEPVRLDGGLYAVHRLIGPYALISPTFRALYDGWLPRSGFRRDSRPGLEVYRNPVSHGTQQICVTDLMIPLYKD